MMLRSRRTYFLCKNLHYSVNYKAVFFLIQNIKNTAKVAYTEQLVNPPKIAILQSQNLV